MFYFYFILFFNLLFDIYFQKNNCNHDNYLTTFNNNYIIFDSSESSDSDSSDSFDCPENCATCANKTYCHSCIDEKYYGDICEYKCDENCLEQKCEKKKELVCKGCENGYFSKNCSEKCPNNCLNNSCDQFSGNCLNCTDQKYHGDKCEEPCNETCKDGKCDINGTCLDCVSGQHLSKDNSSCENCSENCSIKICDSITGTCEICIQNHYGPECNSICNGCLNGCEKLSGDCLNNICNNTFYNSQKCDKNCNQTCQDNLCEMFTGECVNKCEDNIFYWGKNCNESRKCDKDCYDGSKYPYITTDCCLIKNNFLSTNKIIEIYSYYNKQYDVHMINLTSNGQIIPIVIDFNSNANLIIFTEHGVTFKNINDKKKINYNSSLFYNTDTSIELNKSLNNYISGINMTGNLKKDKFNFTNKNNEYFELNVTFLDKVVKIIFFQEIYKVLLD